MEAGPRFEDYKFTRFDDLMLSVDARYHVGSRPNENKVVPFLAGGFSLGWEPVPDGQQTPFFFASSEKFVGRFRHGQSTKCMI